MILKCFIVDDEPLGIKNLSAIIQSHCPQLHIEATYNTTIGLEEEIRIKKPDVLFIDVEMPDGNGIEFISKVTRKDFSVVFVTAHSHYALKALKASATDYLLKPIDITDLTSCVQKIINDRLNQVTGNNNLLSAFYDFINNNKTITKITIPHANGFKLIDLKDIVFMEGNDNYTTIHLINNQELVSSRTLKHFEDLLCDQYFFRIHKTFIVNLFFIREFSYKDGGIVTISTGLNLPVSRRRIGDFLSKLKNYASDIGKN